MKNHIIATIVFSFVALFSIEAAGAEDIDIGSGYICSGTTILSAKGKTVKLATAKTKVQDKIANVTGNSAKSKAKRTVLKATKSKLTKCSKGELTSGSPGEPGGETPGGEAPGDNTAVLGLYTGTLTRASINDEKGGCSDSANPTWTFKILVSSSSGETYVSAGSPFLGAYKGGATTSGFKFIRSDLSILRGAETDTLVATNVTDTSASVTITEKHERIVPKRPRGYDKVFACEATYTGEFSRDKDK